jgi:high-affinity Fe2+/Pb2+ permease
MAFFIGITLGLALLTVMICGYLFGWEWTGLVKDANFTKRTLWDWLELLIVPAVLAAGGLWFTRQQTERQQRISNEQAQDQALQAYLDQIGQLLLDKERPLRVQKRAMRCVRWRGRGR